MAVRKVGQDKKLIRKATCKNCSAKLEYLPKDVKVSWSSIGDSDIVSSYIICPDCRKQVEVKG
jgi:DNA-directed RNA polymerase subunit RPC12/RpoP